ncbi:hypothetical protein AcV5_002472 [Taiwanofungus camphoratus]|nr:hypothetical protein AcV5_002472 [Antrodia cinnamomea]
MPLLMRRFMARHTKGCRTQVFSRPCTSAIPLDLVFNHNYQADRLFALQVEPLSTGGQLVRRPEEFVVIRLNMLYLVLRSASEAVPHVSHESTYCMHRYLPIQRSRAGLLEVPIRCSDAKGRLRVDRSLVYRHAHGNIGDEIASDERAYPQNRQYTVSFSVQ